MKVKWDGEEYELTDPVKLERANKTFSSGATAHELVIEYDKIGGRIVDSKGSVLKTHTFWKRDLEAYRIEFDDFLKSKEKALDKTSEYATTNISHLREFNSTLLTIDVALIGALFTLIASDKTSIIHSFLLFYLGLAALFFDAIYVVFITDAVLISENQTLSKRFKFLQKTFDASIKFLNDKLAEGMSFLKYKELEFENTKKYSEQENTNMSKENVFTGVYFLRAANYIFIGGIILVMAAFIHFSFLLTLLK